MHITGSKLGDPVDFETGFSADEGQIDVKKHIWIYKKQREIIRRMPSKPPPNPQFLPVFRPCAVPVPISNRLETTSTATQIVGIVADAVPYN